MQDEIGGVSSAYHVYKIDEVRSRSYLLTILYKGISDLF